MGEWIEETIVISVPVTLEYDPDRVARDYLVAEAERGLTNSLQHIAGHYRIEGGEAHVLRLTDAERQAVEFFARLEVGANCNAKHANTLRGLLERLGGGR